MLVLMTALNGGSLPTLTAELVEALVEARGGSTGDSCAICLAPYESGDPLRVLRCGHRFHVECVDPWLRGSEQHSCPMCQAPIT